MFGLGPCGGLMVFCHQLTCICTNCRALVQALVQANFRFLAVMSQLVREFPSLSGGPSCRCPSAVAWATHSTPRPRPTALDRCTHWRLTLDRYDAWRLERYAAARHPCSNGFRRWSVKHERQSFSLAHHAWVFPLLLSRGSVPEAGC